jgi:hypothetical protein
VRNLDLVDAARLRRRTADIMRVHVLGNVLGPIFVYAKPDQRLHDSRGRLVSLSGSAPGRRSPNGD